MISNELKERYMQILAQAKDRRMQNFTQKEVSEILGISLRKYVDFEGGKIFDVFLLDQVCSMVCFNLKLEM